MTTDRPGRTSFPLRFHDERTRDLLRLVAERQQVSMNQLAEELITRELDVLALGLETTMSRTIELLRTYRGDQGRAGWTAFAESEALPEPVPTRRLGADDDPFGVAQAFKVRA